MRCLRRYWVFKIVRASCLKQDLQDYNNSPDFVDLISTLHLASVSDKCRHFII